MNFGEVLSRAWNIVWKNKVLWIFGILASCGSSYSSNSFRFSGDQQYWQGREFQLPPGWENLERQLNSLQPVAIFTIIGVLFCVVIFLAILALLASSLGKIGLVTGTSRADQGTNRQSFGELFDSAKPYFWRVVGLNLVIMVGAIILLGGIGVFLAIVGVLTLGIGVLCLLPLLCLLIPGFWLLSIVIKQSVITLVLEDLSITDALQRGWQVFRDNIGTMILMGLILDIGLGLIATLILGLPFFLIVSPLILGFVNGSGDAIRSGWWISGICLVAYIPVLIVLNGILQAYIQSAWTLTYLRLTGSKPENEEVILELDELHPADEPPLVDESDLDSESPSDDESTPDTER